MDLCGSLHPFGAGPYPEPVPIPDLEGPSDQHNLELLALAALPAADFGTTAY